MFNAAPAAFKGFVTSGRGAGAAAWLGYYYFAAWAETD